MTALEKHVNIPKIHVCNNFRELLSTDFLMSDYMEGTSFRYYVHEFVLVKSMQLLLVRRYVI